MNAPQSPLLDYRGAMMFRCTRCGTGLSPDDIFDLGMRLPDRGESRDDYIEAELIDEMMHVACLRAGRGA